MYSTARYATFNAAILVLILVTSAGYTKQNLIDSINSQKVEFKDHLLQYPLFAKIENDYILVSQTNDKFFLKILCLARRIYAF